MPACWAAQLPAGGHRAPPAQGLWTFLRRFLWEHSSHCSGIKWSRWVTRMAVACWVPEQSCRPPFSPAASEWPVFSASSRVGWGYFFFFFWPFGYVRCGSSWWFYVHFASDVGCLFTSSFVACSSSGEASLCLSRTFWWAFLRDSCIFESSLHILDAGLCHVCDLASVSPGLQLSPLAPHRVFPRRKAFNLGDVQLLNFSLCGSSFWCRG